MKQRILSFSGLEFVTVGLVGCRGSKPCAKLPLLCTKIIKQVKRNKKSEIGDIIILVNLYPNVGTTAVVVEKQANLFSRPPLGCANRKKSIGGGIENAMTVQFFFV